MGKTEFMGKARELLQDTSTYRKLHNNRTKATVSLINKKLKSLKDQEKLDIKTYFKVRPSDATVSRFYGLPKIHNQTFHYVPSFLYLAHPHVSSLNTSPTSYNHYNQNFTPLRSKYQQILSIDQRRFSGTRRNHGILRCRILIHIHPSHH